MIKVKDSYILSGDILSIISFPLVHDKIYFIFAQKVSHFSKVFKYPFNGHSLSEKLRHYNCETKRRCCC